MEKFTPNFSLKNIPFSSEDQFNNTTWQKKTTDNFEVTMGSFDTAQITDIPWIHALKPVPVGVVSDFLIFWVIGEFRVFQHHTPLTRTTPSEMINFWVTHRIKR